MSFSQFPLHESLQRAVTATGFQTPTPIQAAAIPVALTGRDLLGTGKTAAFALPILQRLLTTTSTSRRTRALVLAPPRELADQVQASIQQLAGQTTLRSATVVGCASADTSAGRISLPTGRSGADAMPESHAGVRAGGGNRLRQHPGLTYLASPAYQTMLASARQA